MPSGEVRVIPLRGVPEIRVRHDLAGELVTAMRRGRVQLRAGDVLVVKHKIISKAEGRIVKLASVQPRPWARRWAAAQGVDARVAELACSQARRVLRRARGVLITETQHGLVCANSGVDVSNVDGGLSAALLPEDPDRSAARLRRAIRRATGVTVPVIIADSFGRPWRLGVCEVAIGIAGMKALCDYRGRRDRFGYRLRVTEEAVADELACAAGLVCGKLARVPACIVRGFAFPRGAGGGGDLLRPARLDLFR